MTQSRSFSALPPCHSQSLKASATSPGAEESTSELPTKRRKLESDTPPASTSTMTHPTKPIIHLTENEEKLRRLLLDCASHISANVPLRPDGPNSDSPLELRFTGGWVRDKLLKGKSMDIDVGINRMTGYDFGSCLSEFIGKHGEEYGIEGPARGVHKIDSNPDKSKHLETATTKVLGLDVDLVNLRCEAYSEDSRIPVMDFGTPAEDALRRDATVNALFYNLHTQEVEDFTERGLEDMKNKLIRTPLKPWETFNDDPLRVLRLIRFASRLGFEIEPEVKTAMKCDEIKKSLRLKISRERVGTEVEKMLKGRDPHHSLVLVNELGLFTSIFCPPIENLPQLPVEHMGIAINTLNYLMCNTPESLALILSSPHQQYLAWNIAAVIPWNGRFGPKKVPSAALGAKEGLKMKTKDFDVLVAAYKNAPEAQKAVQWNHEQEGGLRREQLGMLIRGFGAHWTNQILCALLVEQLDVWELDKEGKPTSAALEIVEKYNRFVGRVYELGLESAFSFTPIINGKQLSKLLEKSSGPWMRGALEKIVEWQLKHPEKGLAEAEKFAKAEFA